MKQQLHTAMGSLTYVFAKHPEIQQRCYEEIQQMVADKREINHETIGELKYLEACIQVNYDDFGTYCNIHNILYNTDCRIILYFIATISLFRKI